MAGDETVTLALRRHGPQRGHHHHLGHSQHGRQGGQLEAVTLIFISATTNKCYMLCGKGKHDFVCPSQTKLTNAECNVDVVQHVIIISLVSVVIAQLSILWCLSLLRVAEAERN